MELRWFYDRRDRNEVRRDLAHHKHIKSTNWSG
jgi:hypothetical protein